MRTLHYVIAFALAGVIVALLATPCLGEAEPAATGGTTALDALTPSGGVDAPEMLLFQEIPTVISASRIEERVTDAPASVTVITREQILNSGAISIPDILRMAPGVDVMQNTGANWDVSIRGFVHVASNKVLVLIDGRTVYNDFYASVNWYELPVVLEDIERIEVIRGPLSSVWGANAYLGVINIITRTAAGSEGSIVTGAWGGRGTLRAVGIHGGGLGTSVSYKVSASREEVGQWSHPLNTAAPGFDDRKAGDATKLSASAEWRDDQGANWVASAGRTDGGIMMLLDLTRDHRLWEETINYASLAYNREDLRVRAYWNGSRLHYHQDDMPLPAIVYADLYDLEAIGSRTIDKHGLVYGASLRQKSLGQTGLPVLDGPHHQNIWAGYVEDAYQASDRAKLVLAGRYDHHPLVGGRVSGRATVMYSLSSTRLLRVSAANAYRNPSFLESYLFMPWTDLFGNHDLDPEGVTSYDVEYRAQLSRDTSAGLAVYYSKLDDLIHVQQFSGPLGQVFENLGRAQATGAEFELRHAFSPRLSGFANYTYQSLKADAVIDRDRPDIVGASPRNKANLGVTLADPDRGLNGNLLLNYRDETTVDDRSAGPYLLVNGYIGKKIGPHAEAGLSFFNLANYRHQEYPFGDFIGRRLMGTVRWEF
jgi:iron complex outermembrane receptor protein